MVIIIIIVIILNCDITTLVAKCPIDSVRLRGTGSMCHMFFVKRITISGFPVSLFDRLAFSIPAFSVTQTNRVLEVARIFYKTSEML